MMNKLIKIISAAIIILALTLGVIVTWKIVNNIRQSVRQDLQVLQGTFKNSLELYGKR